MGRNSKDKIRIHFLSKVFEAGRMNTPSEVSRFISIDRESIEAIKQENLTLIFEFKQDEYWKNSNADTQKWEDNSDVDLLMNGVKKQPTLAISYSKDTYDRKIDEYNKHYTKSLHASGVTLQQRIPTDKLEQFLQKGAFALNKKDNRYRQNIVFPTIISFKIMDKKGNISDEITNFQITSNFLKKKDVGQYVSLSKYLQKKLHEEDQRLNQDYTRYERGSMICFVSDIFRNYNEINKEQKPLINTHKRRTLRRPTAYSHYTYLHKVDTVDGVPDPDRRISNKPYFLMRFVRTHPIYGSSSSIDHNVSRDSYDGSIAAIMKEKNQEFITLESPHDVQWVDLKGIKYLPINYTDEQFQDASRFYKLEATPYDDYTLLRPFSEGLSVDIKLWDPHRSKWVHAGIIPSINRNTTEITYNSKKDKWVTTELDRWDYIQSPITISEGIQTRNIPRAIDPTKRIKRFIVESMHRASFTISIARGVGQFKNSKNILDRAVPLIDLLPPEKARRQLWSNAKEIYCQQSTMGLNSDAHAILFEIDPKTKKIIQKFDKNYLGSPVSLDGNKFRNGSYLLAFGPNTARFDITPLRDFKASKYDKKTKKFIVNNETHGLLAQGYYQKTDHGNGKNNREMLFNY